MKYISSYRFMALLAVIVILCGCKAPKRINPLISLWRKDKNAYGTFYAFEQLKYIFPNADTIAVNTISPSKFPEVNEIHPSSPGQPAKMAYIIVSPIVRPDASEVNALMDFVGQGNSVFISAFFMGDTLLKYLKVHAVFRPGRWIHRDSMQLDIVSPVADDTLAFEYPGFSMSSYIDSVDLQYATILGTDERGRPDFIRFNYKGGGAIFLHFAPLAFSNFFLLHHHNKDYYDYALSYMPKSVRSVRWDDYFRYGNKRSFSALKFLLGNPPFKWALWLLLIFFLFIYLFESKRKQRLIPTLAPLRNSSLDFVKTIGQLYYQRRDHLNLAGKMIAHFLGHVRTKYNLSTTTLDQEFIDRLSYKSGCGKELVKVIVGQIKGAQQQQSLSNEDLVRLNEGIAAFFLNT